MSRRAVEGSSVVNDHSTTSPDDFTPAPLGIDPDASRWIFLGFLGLIAGGGLAYWLLSDRLIPPPPADIATDPTLARGFTVYRERCLGCHGETGEGNGPTARALAGPHPGDFTAASWKYGDNPREVLALIQRGAAGSAMPGFQGLEEESALRAVTAYILHLGGRPIPEFLREGQPPLPRAEDEVAIDDELKATLDSEPEGAGPAP